MSARPSVKFIASSCANPCVVCGRTKDGDCRISSDGLQLICHYGTSHHPPEKLKPGQVIDGRDGKRWAFTGDTADGRAAVFTLDKQRHQPASVVPFRPHVSSRKAAPTTQAPIAGPVELARLPVPANEPPAHLPDGMKLPYSPCQWVQVERNASGDKQHKPWHIDADGREVKRKGSALWPLWHEADALTYGPSRWIVEAEGEKCADWPRAGGLVSVSQPGHDHTLASITRRYQRLVDAGVAGVIYLADNDKTGIEKAEKCQRAAAAAGLPLLVVPAVAVWPGLPEGGSIDDAPGTAAERVAALLAAIPAVLERQQEEEDGRPKPLTFEQRWELLELHAAEMACATWPVMKTVASLACKASELEIPRLGQRQLEQLLEQAQRKVRAKSEPVMGGGTFTIQPTPWAVDGLFRHGLNLLVGQSGAGKSRLAAACMAAWLRGDETWLGVCCE